MKKLKRSFAALLAALMLTGIMTAGATAATLTPMTETGTITIKNALAGATYELYRVFDINAIKEGTDQVTYITNQTWHDVIWNLNGGYGTVAENNVGSVVTPNTDFTEPAQAQAFAKKAIDAKGEIAADKTVTVTESGTKEIDGLQYGFYIMVSSRTSASGEKQYTTFTLKSDALTIDEKNVQYPHITKTVNGVASVSTDFEATLSYKIVLAAAAGTDTYTIKDKMDQYIEYTTGTLKVQMKKGDVKSDLTQDTQYTVTQNGKETSVTLDPSIRNVLADGDEIIITYDATLPQNTDTATGYANNVVLEYKDSAQRPVTSSATVFSGFIRFHKLDLGTTNLAGAKFVIQNKTTKQYAKLTQVTAGLSYYFNGWVNTVAEATEIETINDANAIMVRGFAADTYVLIETEAPTNYIKGADTDFVIGEVRNTAGELESLTIPAAVNIRNTPGSELPGTGGIGSTIFYTAGSLLVLGAVVLFIVKRRKTA